MERIEDVYNRYLHLVEELREHQLNQAQIKKELYRLKKQIKELLNNEKAYLRNT